MPHISLEESGWKKLIEFLDILYLSEKALNFILRSLLFSKAKINILIKNIIFENERFQIFFRTFLDLSKKFKKIRNLKMNIFSLIVNVFTSSINDSDSLCLFFILFFLNRNLYVCINRF